MQAIRLEITQADRLIVLLWPASRLSELEHPWHSMRRGRISRGEKTGAKPKRLDSLQHRALVILLVHLRRQHLEVNLLISARPKKYRFQGPREQPQNSQIPGFLFHTQYEAFP